MSRTRNCWSASGSRCMRACPSIAIVLGVQKSACSGGNSGKAGDENGERGASVGTQLRTSFTRAPEIDRCNRKMPKSARKKLQEVLRLPLGSKRLEKGAQVVSRRQGGNVAPVHPAGKRDQSAGERKPRERAETHWSRETWSISHKAWLTWPDSADGGPCCRSGKRGQDQQP